MESDLRRIFRARQSAPRLEWAATWKPWPEAQDPLGDITGGTETDERIAACLREKDALLRSVHHRVNNNLQMVSSLLQLQANYIEDPKLLDSFQDCRDRIRTMTLIHQKVRRTGALAQIDFKECLEALTDMLLRDNKNGVKVRRQLNLEPVVLDIDTAIPLGLIANELISGSLKHGFVGRREGLVRVSLTRQCGDQFRLAIGDDGCGSTRGCLEGNPLGLRLVKVLTGQIRGQLEYKNENGAEIVIVFKDSRSDIT